MQAQLQEQLAAGEEATEEETQYARLRAEKVGGHRKYCKKSQCFKSQDLHVY